MLWRNVLRKKLIYIAHHHVENKLIDWMRVHNQPKDM